MAKKIDSPEKASINSLIKSVESDYFDSIENLSKKRGNAFQHLCASIICDVDENDVNDEEIIDGNDEEGIDVINIKGLGDDPIVRILNCKSSISDGYSANDLTKLREGLRIIFEADKNEISELNNIKFQNQINLIKKSKREIRGIEVYYCVFNGVHVSDNVDRKVSEILSYYTRFLKTEYPLTEFSLTLIGSKELYDLKNSREESLRGVEVKVPFFDPIRREIPVETTKDGISGYITTFSGKEISKLVKKYGDKLFDKNIRGWLRYNTVNKEIYDAASSETSNMFWFMNNGITFICDDVFADNDKKKWILTNPQVVNGQQTARMLFEASKDEKLKNDAKVLCRIYKAKNQKFIQNIVKATNTQSSIGHRDLASNDSIQKAIQDELRKFGFFYQRQRNENPPEGEVIEVVTSMKMAQVSLAILCSKPSVARRNNENNFFNENKFYKEIFVRNPEELLIAYLIYKYCEDNKNETDAASYFGTLHIARILWKFVKENLEKDMNKNISKLKDGKINLKSKYKKSLNILKKILNTQNIKEENYKSYLSSNEVDELIFRELNN